MLNKLDRETLIIAGDARGLDEIVRELAPSLGFTVVVEYADWSKYGRSAGPIRNSAMLDWKPDEVIAFHENLEESKGTKNMIKQATDRGIKVTVYTLGEMNGTKR